MIYTHTEDELLEPDDWGKEIDYVHHEWMKRNKFGQTISTET